VIPPTSCAKNSFSYPVSFSPAPLDFGKNLTFSRPFSRPPGRPPLASRGPRSPPGFHIFSPVPARPTALFPSDSSILRTRPPIRPFSSLTEFVVFQRHRDNHSFPWLPLPPRFVSLDGRPPFGSYDFLLFREFAVNLFPSVAINFRLSFFLAFSPFMLMFQFSRGVCIQLLIGSETEFASENLEKNGPPYSLYKPP